MIRGGIYVDAIFCWEDIPAQGLRVYATCVLAYVQTVGIFPCISGPTYTSFQGDETLTNETHCKNHHDTKCPITDESLETHRTANKNVSSCTVRVSLDTTHNIAPKHLLRIYDLNENFCKHIQALRKSPKIRSFFLQRFDYGVPEQTKIATAQT